MQSRLRLPGLNAFGTYPHHGVFITPLHSQIVTGRGLPPPQAEVDQLAGVIRVKPDALVLKSRAGFLGTPDLASPESPRLILRRRAPGVERLRKLRAW